MNNIIHNKTVKMHWTCYAWLPKAALVFIFFLIAVPASCSQDDTRHKAADSGWPSEKQQVCEKNGDDQKQSRLPVLRGQRRAISLRILSDHVGFVLESGKLPSEEVLNLGGIGQVEGFVISKENADIILIGRYEQNRPALGFDDLLTALRNAWGTGPYPYCSLDPRKENVLKLEKVLKAEMPLDDPHRLKQYADLVRDAIGPQQVVVGGVELHTPWAATMVAADYHMKAVSQGHHEIEGIPSIPSMSLEHMKETITNGRKVKHSGSFMSRFWFHLAPCDPTYLESDGIIYLKSCRVVLLTEGQRAKKDGTLKDSGKNDPMSVVFAESFSARFSHATTIEPSYARLENLYRLLAVAHAMRLKDAPGQAGLDFSFYLSDSPYLTPLQPKTEFPPLVNYLYEQITDDSRNRIYYVAPLVCGGVSMDLGAIAKRIFSKKADQKILTEVKQVALKTRPDKKALWWNMPEKYEKQFADIRNTFTN